MLLRRGQDRRLGPAYAGQNDSPLTTCSFLQNTRILWGWLRLIGPRSCLVMSKTRSLDGREVRNTNAACIFEDGWQQQADVDSVVVMMAPSALAECTRGSCNRAKDYQRQAFSYAATGYRRTNYPQSVPRLARDYPANPTQCIALRIM